MKWRVSLAIALQCFAVLAVFPGDLNTRISADLSSTSNKLFDDPTCNTPSQIVLTDATETSLTIGWADYPDALSFPVQYRLKGTTAWNNAVATGTGTTISDLASGMAYQFRMRSECSGSLLSVWSAASVFYTTGAPACLVPQAPLVNSVDDNSANISWYASASAIEYSVRYKINTGWTEVTTSEPSISLTELYSGTVYTYQVRSVCSEDGSVVSPYSPAKTFATTGETACPAPPGLTATATDTQAILNWDQQETAFEYELQWRISGGTWLKKFLSTPGYTLNGLFTGTGYEVRVRSTCTADRTVKSTFSTATFTTSGPPTCEAAHDFSFVIGDNQAEVSWLAAGGTSFETRYRIKGTSVWNTQIVTSPEITLTGLYGGTGYDLTVKTSCGSVKTVVTSVSFTTTGSSGCAAPSALKVTSVSSNQADIEWTPNGTLNDQFEVQYRVKNGAVWEKQTTSESSTMLDGLLSGTAYQVRVRSLCTPDGLLTSGFSTVVNFTTVGSFSCGIPLSLDGMVIDGQSVDLSWTSTTGAMLYELQYRPTGTTKWSSLLTTQSDFLLINLQPTEYQWHVRSVCSADKSVRSNWSGIATFDTFTAETSSTSNIHLLVSPNPVSDLLTIRFALPASNEAVVGIYKVGGGLVSQAPLANYTGNVWSEVTWDASAADPGIYVVRITTASLGKVSARFEVVH